MGDDMTDNGDVESKSIQIATQVIIHAGNARSLVYEAFKDIESSNYTACDEKLAQARDEISAAHNVQTELIQAEARGEEVRLSLLLTHAQDTLMIAMSERMVAQRLANLVQNIEKKIQR